MSYEDVLTAAKSLTQAERSRLVYEISNELPVIDEELLAEIERRSDEYDKGNVTAIPWPEARARARREAGLDG